MEDIMTPAQTRARDEWRARHPHLGRVVYVMAWIVVTIGIVVFAATIITIIPVLVVGSRAEEVAETLEPGDLIAIESGKLAYKAGKTKDAGKLVVVTFDVERLSGALALPVESAN
jgi:hypothetical protein